MLTLVFSLSIGSKKIGYIYQENDIYFWVSLKRIMKIGLDERSCKTQFILKMELMH
jgi:hypothetical protein